MSILQYPDTINDPNLQIWNNAAFDNLSESLELDSSKENRSPVFCKSPNIAKSPVPIKPLGTHAAHGNCQGKPLKLLFKEGLLLPPSTIKANDNVNNEKIDTEIEEIEKEIGRLKIKLENLRIEKAERNSNTTIERRGRIVPAKFMEQKQSSKIPTTPGPKKIQESPAEHVKFRPRGYSLGPSEIGAGVRSRQSVKPEITPLLSTKSRRKSCFWKLPEVEEEVKKDRGRSMSLSPKSRRSVAKMADQRKGIATVGSKKPLKRDDSMLTCLQPKKLFREGDKPVAGKKQAKNFRVVASRYNAGDATENSRRKRSLPENGKEESKKVEKNRSLSTGKSRVILPESVRNPVKKHWEVPSEGKCRSGSTDTSPPSISKVGELLPKIKAVRCTTTSPRDSGRAKRVADLVGRKSYFRTEESDVATSVCNVLGFDEEEE